MLLEAFTPVAIICAARKQNLPACLSTRGSWAEGTPTYLGHGGDGHIAIVEARHNVCMLGRLNVGEDECCRFLQGGPALIQTLAADAGKAEHPCEFSFQQKL